MSDQSIQFKRAIEQIASTNPYIDSVRIFDSMGKIVMTIHQK